MKVITSAPYVPALRLGWLTPLYDLVVRATTRELEFKQALIAQAHVGPLHDVLDLATGTGTLALWLKAQQPLANIIGIDGDPAILAIAINKARRADLAVKFDHGLSFQLPYLDERFDRVVSSLFFHHLTWDNKQSTAREIFRVLKPGGELHVADWGRPANPLMRGLFLFVQLLDGFANTRDNVNGRLIELFTDAEFSDVSSQQSFNTVFGTLTLYRAVKPDRVQAAS